MTSIKKKSLAILSFFTLLSMTLPIFLVQGYCFAQQFYEGNQDKRMFVQLKGPSTGIESTAQDPAQLIMLADNRQAISNRPAAGKKEQNIQREVLKEAGGSLYAISMKHYQRANETLFDLILQANPSITDVRQINDDQEVILPIITPESYIRRVSGGLYRVHVGTFESSETARSYSDILSGLNRVLILESQKFSPKDTWYRLMASSFSSKKEALETVNQLREQGIIYIPLTP